MYRAAPRGLCSHAFVPMVLALLVLLGCNRPAPRGPCSLEGPIGTICGFENPEDIEYLPAEGIVVVSDLRMWSGKAPGGGFLSAFIPGGTEVWKIWPLGAPTDARTDPSLGDPSCAGSPTPGAFYPHGIVATPRGETSLLYVVAHAGPTGGREAVEVFEISGRGKKAVATWKACIPTPGHVLGNDAAVAPDGEIIVSNYQPTGSEWHAVRSVLFRQITGDVMAWKPGRGWRRLEGSAARQPNGVAVSPDGKNVFYSETGSGRVFRIPREGEGESIFVQAGGNPDNLSWTPRGTLLVTTHTGGAAFLLCANGRLPCRTSWEVHEINSEKMTERLVLSHRGDLLGAVSSALELGDRMYLGSVFSDRIGVVAVAR